MKKALLAAEVSVECVIMAFDEMDRNRDQLVTYEEFRYYVSQVPGIDVSKLINVENLSHMMTTSDGQRLEQWRDTWLTKANSADEKISIEDAVDCLRENARQKLSAAIIRGLKTQMDVNADGMIEFFEFARACEKILVDSNTLKLPRTKSVIDHNTRLQTDEQDNQQVSDLDVDLERDEYDGQYELDRNYQAQRDYQ